MIACPVCGFEWNPAESNGSHDCTCFLREEIERLRSEKLKMGVLEAVSVLSKVLEIHAFTQSDAEIADTMRQMFLKLPDLFVKLESIEGILWDYHRALDTRQHASTPASRRACSFTRWSNFWRRRGFAVRRKPIHGHEPPLLPPKTRWCRRRAHAAIQAGELRGATSADCDRH